MRSKTIKRIWSVMLNFFIFFLMVAFVITCCTMLFVTVLAENLDIVLTDENIALAAKMTFLNVLLLSSLFTVFDTIRRRRSVGIPIQKITEAAEKMIAGDFSVRIKHVRGWFDEEAFNSIIDCFNRMAQELSGTETLRTDFVANVSHELKTPLAVMQNYGTMLSSPHLSDAERVEYAKAITDASKRLSSLITNILKLNKLENQQIFPTVSEYDLSEQIAECLLNFEDAWEKKNINIETDIDDSVMIRSDAELLSLVWNNLFSNAIKFTEEGGTVSVSLKAENGGVCVRVSDTGCGMSPEVGAHIFEKFYQGDTSHATQGNGLGLALVKRVVDIMHGEISIQSVIGEGTTFTVKI